MKWKRIAILWIMGVLWTSMSMAFVGASTTDISYLLPGGGHFDNESCNNLWAMSTCYGDPNIVLTSSTDYFHVAGDQSYVGLRCFARPTSYTRRPARIGILNIDISDYKRNELLVSVTFRGSPDPLYGNGTIYGYFQPEVNSAYQNNWYMGALKREPGSSPGYLEAVSFKAESADTTQTDFKYKYNYGILMVSTTWNTFSWHIIPTSQDYYRIGFLGLKYLANPFYTKRGPDITTEIQIKEIKLQLIRRY